jgi:hypothetical protein
MDNSTKMLNSVDSKVVKESLLDKIKLRSIMMLTAIMLLIYFITNIDSYSVAINEEVRISRTLVNIINYIPYPNVLLIILLIFLIWCLCIKSGIKKFIGYIVSVIIIDVSIAVTMSDLMLENNTSLYLINIHHVMPIQARLDYLYLELLECYNHSPIIPTIIESKLVNIAKYIERSVDIVRLNHMNANDIKVYIT